MNRRLSLLCACLFGSVASVAAQGEAKGVVIYQQPGTSKVEAIEFRLAARDSLIYATVVTRDGVRRQLKNKGVLAVVDYPPMEFDSSLEARASSAIGDIQEFIRQFPNAKKELEAALGKWERARSVYVQKYGAPKAAPRSAPSLPEITIAGERYANVRLLSAGFDYATLAHDGGVLRFPVSYLENEQVVRLNTTSTSAQLPSRGALGASEPISKATQKIETAGAKVLGFIAHQVRVPYRTFSVWTLFVVLPSFVLVLLIVNFWRKRRAP